MNDSRATSATGARSVQIAIRNILSNFAGRFTSLVVGLLLTPFILHRLGPADYGLWALAGSVIAYLWLLDLGIAGAVIKYLAEHRAKGETEQAHNLVTTALRIYTALGALAFLLSLVIAAVFPLLFTLSPDQHQKVTWLIAVMGLGLGAFLPAMAASAVLRGLQRYDIVNIVDGTAAILTAIGTVVALLLGGGLIGLVAVSTPVALTVLALSIWFINRIAPELHIGWRSRGHYEARKIVNFSAAIFVINIASQVETKTDEVVIAAVMPIAAVTPYSIARKLSGLPQLLADQFMKVLLPLASEFEARDDRFRLRGLYMTSTRLTLAIFIPVALVITVLGEHILSLWVGSVYASYAHLITILTLASLVDTSQWPAGSVLQSMTRHHPLAIMAVVSALCNLALSIVLAHRMGLTGVALGTLIPTILVYLGFALPYALRVIGVGVREALRSIVLPILPPTVLAALTLFLLRQAVPVWNWLSLCLTAMIGLGVYVVSYVIIGASALEREAYRTAIADGMQLIGPFCRRAATFIRGKPTL